MALRYQGVYRRGAIGTAGVDEGSHWPDREGLIASGRGTRCTRKTGTLHQHCLISSNHIKPKTVRWYRKLLFFLFNLNHKFPRCIQGARVNQLHFSIQLAQEILNAYSPQLPRYSARGRQPPIPTSALCLQGYTSHAMRMIEGRKYRRYVLLCTFV